MIKVFVIEDVVQVAEETVIALNREAEEKGISGSIEFEFLRGTIEETGEEEKSFFYEENIIEELEAKIREANGDTRIGLLLDVLLTKEEADSVLFNYYPRAGLSKKIYFHFQGKIPVYIITSISGFATRCDIIMGTDLSECYIDKNALLLYCLQEDIERLFEFYMRYYKTNE